MQKKNQIANSKIKKEQINTKEDINILKNFTSNQKSLNYNINEEIYDKNIENNTNKISKLIF